MAHRKHALGLLQRSQNIFETLPFPTQDFDEENEIAAAHIEFLEENEKCFHSNHPVGHFTASSLIVDKTFSRVLLTHHKKLNMWLQLGGHADGNSQIHETAMREAKEESGLTNIHFVNIDALKDPEDNDLPLPFDLDYHRIPKRKEMEAHIHYDFRFIMIADEPEKIVMSEESHDLKWFSLDEAREVTDERSMLRMFHKLEALVFRGIQGTPDPFIWRTSSN